jgi:hypothetical protein
VKVKIKKVFFILASTQVAGENKNQAQASTTSHLHFSPPLRRLTPDKEEKLLIEGIKTTKKY